MSLNSQLNSYRVAGIEDSYNRLKVFMTYIIRIKNFKCRIFLEFN